ncbi:MAG: beta strand repeat-containing protein, partial [Tepidisphaerales bacterium]
STFTNTPGGTAHWTFTGGTNYTDQSGDVAINISKATANVTVNGYTGVYDAAAHGATGSATGVGGVVLSGLDLGSTFTNTPGGTAHWTFTGGTNYTDQSGDVAINISKANAAIVVTPYNVTYDGAGHTATGTAKGVLGESLSGLVLTGTTHTNAGTFAADPWTFTDATGNYNNASGTVSDSIGLRDLYVTASNNSKTYGDTAHDTGTISGVQGLDGITASFSSAGDAATAPVGTGSYTISDTLSDPNGKLSNYVVHETPATLTVNKATAAITVTPYSVTYDSKTHTATGTAKGVLGESLSGLVLTGTTHTNASTFASDPWTFTDTTGNYNNASGSVTDIIAKASATISVTPYSVTYDGATHTATGTAKGVLGESLSGLVLTGTTHIGAGTFATDAWTFTDTTGNYNNASGTVTDIIAKANPVLTWANPADITSGTALSGTQLNAAANVLGAFAYTPAAGTVLGAGNGQTLSVAFTPTDTTDYNTASATVKINVLAASSSSASGHVYNDLSGNGLSADDTPMSGVIVNLFRDVNGNGTLDSGDGAAVATTTTNASGAYSFGGLTAGNTYFVQEVLPSGYVRTAPALSDNYAVPVTGLTNATGLDFDNFNKTCCTNSVANVSFLINGTTTVTNLRGATHQGDTVVARFTVTGTASQTLSFVTYNAPDAVFNADDANLQTVDQLASGSFAPGPHSLTVTIPANFYQIDFVCGLAIDTLGPAGSNIFYSAQSRLISADNGGLHSDTDDEAATTCFWNNLGQTLIKSFGGSACNTDLGNWLATTYPKMYGASCPNSANNLSGDTNTTVAALFKSFYKNNTHCGADAQVMATALNVYASTLSLGGAVADTAQYGFDATTGGLGAAEFNVGNNGAAFNVANNSTLTVSQMLAVANAKSTNDVLYNNVTSLLQMAYNMFSQVNGSGGL